MGYGFYQLRVRGYRVNELEVRREKCVRDYRDDTLSIRFQRVRG